MANKPKNAIEVDTQPAYDPPQALRMGDIHAGAGGVSCAEAGSGFQGSCLPGTSAAVDCSTGDGATGNCIQPGNGFVAD
jgi:hypothetical protein